MPYTGWLGDQKTTTPPILQPARRTSADIYNTRLPTSSRRYDQPQRIRRGNQEFVVHHKKPPTRRRPMPWPVLIIIGAIGTLIIIFMSGVVSGWWSNHQADSKYGYPRTYHIDAVVGHNDSEAHPSHFQFENLGGRVIIIEISGGDAAHSHIYTGPTLMGDNADKIVVIGEFDEDRNMIVSAGQLRIVYLNDGTQFIQQQ